MRQYGSIWDGKGYNRKKFPNMGRFMGVDGFQGYVLLHLKARSDLIVTTLLLFNRLLK